ncbi:MAG: AAA family ATPase [Planctomycetaceae bacterium]
MTNTSTIRIAVLGDGGTDVLVAHHAPLSFINQFPIAPDSPAIRHTLVYEQEFPSGSWLIGRVLNHCVTGADIEIWPAPQRLPSFRWRLAKSLWPDSNSSVIRISGLELPQLHNNSKKDQSDSYAEPNGEAPLQYIAIHDSTDEWRKSTEVDRAGGDKAAPLPHRQLEKLLPRLGKSGGRSPNIFVNIGWKLPNLKIRGDAVYVDDAPSDIWSTLLREVPEDTAIILSASDFRQANATVSRRLSWEQTLEDTITEFDRYPPLMCLRHFGHVVIRFGFIGALYTRWTNDNGQRTCNASEFVFCPEASRGVFRDEGEHGKIMGRGAFFIASLIRVFEENASEQPRGPEMFREAMLRGLTAAMRKYDEGFECPERIEDGNADLETYFRSYVSFEKKRHTQTPIEASIDEILSTRYSDLLRDGKVARDRQFGVVSNVAEKKGANPKGTEWQILRDQVGTSELSRVNIGIAIALFGHKVVLNAPVPVPSKGGLTGVADKRREEFLRELHSVLTRQQHADFAEVDLAVPKVYPPEFANPLKARKKCKSPAETGIYIPLATFGKLTAIERSEIEAFRSIQNLLKLYFNEAATSGAGVMSPLSIAVFGRPGSGKSFAVKQIAKTASSAGPFAKLMEQVECNVAQFRSVEDLEAVLTRVASINNRGRMPLVFFDEFDAEFQGGKLGWLKYFLGPMQDGTFYGARHTISFGRSIFVFAGGTAHSLEEFEIMASAPDDEDSGRRHSGTEGEDFDVNFPPKPPVDGRQFNVEAIARKVPDFLSRLRGHIDIVPIDASPGGMKPILRRAFLLRSLIEQAGYVLSHGDQRICLIDEEVIFALLTMSTYRHGARSMESVLKMCVPVKGRITAAALPSSKQLAKHLDGEELLNRVARGRARLFEGDDHSMHSPGEALQQLFASNGPE